MTLDINKLEAAAKAATPGPWITCGPSFGAEFPVYLNEVVTDPPDEYQGESYTVAQALDMSKDVGTRDMDYIATANPQAVLELIARLREAEKDAARWRKHVELYAARHGVPEEDVIRELDEAMKGDTA